MLLAQQESFLKHKMTVLNIPKFPQRIVIELTPLCNLSCAMCPRNYSNVGDGFMAKDLWIKLIGEISNESPEAMILPFWRGESLLHPSFIELMEYALKKRSQIHISTNGHLVKDHFAEVLLHCEFVTFSVHTKLGYDRAREFLAMRNGNKPVVQISFVKGEKSTAEFLSSIVSSPTLKSFDSIRLYEEHTKEGVFGNAGIAHSRLRTFCPKLIDTLVIGHDGSISRCNHLWKTETELNLNDISIKEAWGTNRLQWIRENYPDDSCLPCDQWTGHTLGESWRLIDGKIVHTIFSPEGISHV